MRWGTLEPWGLWHDVQSPWANGACPTFDFVASCVLTWQEKQSGACSWFSRRGSLPECGAWQDTQPFSLATGAWLTDTTCAFSPWHVTHSALPSAAASFRNSEA